jgi:hypothetical protein
MIDLDSRVRRHGLGDGYYPISENRNLGMRARSLVIVFKIWAQANWYAGPGFTSDEYGIPTR